VAGGDWLSAALGAERKENIFIPQEKRLEKSNCLSTQRVFDFSSR